MAYLVPIYSNNRLDTIDISSIITHNYENLFLICAHILSPNPGTFLPR